MSRLTLLLLLAACPKGSTPSAPATDATRRVTISKDWPALCVREGEPRSEALVEMIRGGQAEAAQEGVATLLEAEPHDACLLAAGAVIDLIVTQDRSASTGARAYAKVRAPKRAEASWQAAPGDPDNALLLAWLVGSSDPERALEVLQQAFDANPDNADVAWALGSLLASKGRMVEASAPLLAAHRAGHEGIDSTLLSSLYASGERAQYLRLADELGQPMGPAKGLASAEDPWATYLAALGLAPGASLQATLVTSMGEIHCLLLHESTPVTVANFVGLAEGTQSWTDPTSGQVSNGPLYSGTRFHRVIPDFMIQGGDPLGTGTGDPGYRFLDELDPEIRFDGPMYLAMANSGPGTNGSQFFVTEAATPHLDGRHTIFGKCAIEDLPVVQSIARVPAGRSNDPLQPVLLQAVRIDRIPSASEN